jgi:rfaE bifunctional protein kinase chain/domain
VNAAQILDAMRDLRVMVVGDVCLDRWCRYDPALTEPSRETGIPRLAVVSTEVTPGATGTIANNLVSLGVRHVELLGVVGDDGFGWELIRALRHRAIASELLVHSSTAPTFTYTKLINQTNGEEDQPRLDFVNPVDIAADVEAELVSRLRSRFADFDVVIVCDQAETERGGVVTPAVRDALIELASGTPDKVVWVDSRVRIEHFRHVIAKPNAMEAEQACFRALNRLDLRLLREHCEFKLLVVTEGGEGVRLIDDKGEDRVPGRKVNVVDICGAGDSFSAGAACALAVMADARTAAWFGNLVASITVQKKGTGTASPAEVLQAAQEGA